MEKFIIAMIFQILLIMKNPVLFTTISAVSHTHLDVYKRQGKGLSSTDYIHLLPAKTQNITGITV